MANIVFKVGTLDLSSYTRVNPNEHLDLGQGDMIDPAFSDSPFFEGQILTSIHAKNKELKVPLFLHPPTAPYTNDALNQLVQQVNQALRPINDLGLTVYAEWRNAQASNSTFFTIQFGRFEPDFNFRITEKGWLAGVLHLWVLPYGHTATERIVGTVAAPANQSGFQVIPSAIFANGGTIVGDVPPQIDLRMTVGSYLGDDGRVGIISALPIASYNPIIPIASFFGLSPSAVIQGASGAWASQYLAVDAGVAGGSGGLGYFSFAVSPGSVYAGAGDNRLLGLVRARFTPFGLRAFDQRGNPLGPTVIASALDGWQVVDYGTLRVPPWTATAQVGVQVYGGIDYSASGMFAPRRAAPAWTKEIGPMFIVPNQSSIIDLDFDSTTISIDGFDNGVSGATLAADQLGNQWVMAGGQMLYTGSSAIRVPSSSAGQDAWVGQPIAPNQDFEMEGVFNILSVGPSQAGVNFNNIGLELVATQGNALGHIVMGVGVPSGAYLSIQYYTSLGFATGIASMAIPSMLAGAYHMRFISRASQVWVNLAAPSGVFPQSASGAVASLGAVPTGWMPRLAAGYAGIFSGFGNAALSSYVIESFRARTLASQGYQSRDILRLSQPLVQNTRMTPSALDVTDLQSRQRGAVQAAMIPVPSLGSGLFVASFPWDQGPANDLLNVDIRLRERFTYAR